MTRLITLVLVLAGLSLVVPPAHADVRVSIRAVRTDFPAGDSTAIRGKAAGAKYGSVVKLQRKVRGSWRTIKKKRVWSTRRYSFRVRPSRGIHRLRVKKAWHRGQPPAASATVRLAVLAVAVRASPTTLLEGESTRIRGKAFAADRGSVVRLQRRTRAGWRTVASRKVWSRRTFRFTTAPPKGNQRYRVVKPRQFGQPWVASRRVSIGVTDGPSITTDALPQAAIGHSYQVQLTGDRNGTWSAEPLPAGLALDSKSGVLSGTPEGPSETVQVTLTLTDSYGYQDTTTLPLAVREPPSITTDALPEAVIGRPYTAQLNRTDWNGTWSAEPLPAGLALDSKSGVLSGTPEGPSEIVQLTLTLTDAHGYSDTTTVPLTVREPSKWASLSPSCGIRLDGTGWCWGARSADPSRIPTQVPGTWSNMQFGSATLGITADDSGWWWGSNTWQRLGDTTVEQSDTPIQLPGSWSSLEAGAYHTCGVAPDATGWCWGNNAWGEVGDGTTTYRGTPVQLPGSWNTLSVGYQTTCGIRTDNTGWCWGRNTNGEIGDGTTSEHARPHPFQLQGEWTLLQNHGFRTCGIRIDGTGWCWGANGDGQIGNGNKSDWSAPTQLPGTWVTLGLGYRTTCGIQTDNTVWCWGRNGSGEVGDGTTTDRPAPVQVPGQWSSISTSDRGACGIQLDDSGWCWGAVARGTGGDGNTTSTPAPTQVPGSWDALYPGSTTCGIRTDKTGWCWGHNNLGQVGDGTTEPRHSPVLLP